MDVTTKKVTSLQNQSLFQDTYHRYSEAVDEEELRGVNVNGQKIYSLVPYQHLGASVTVQLVICYILTGI